MAQRCHVDQVRVLRVDADHADLLRVLQTDVRPGLACVQRLVNAVAVRGIAADRALACAHINHVVVGVRYRNRSDGTEVDVPVGDRLPNVPAVRRLEDAATGSAEVEDQRFAGNASDRIDATAAEGTDLAQRQRVESTCWSFRFFLCSSGLSRCGSRRRLILLRRGRMLSLLCGDSQGRQRQCGGKGRAAAERESRGILEQASHAKLLPMRNGLKSVGMPGTNGEDDRGVGAASHVECKRRGRIHQLAARANLAPEPGAIDRGAVE